MCDLNIKIKIVFIMLCFSTVSFAEMYKWVDENGKTHYSQSPPVSDVKVETIAPPPPVDTSNAQKEVQNNVEKADALREKRLVAKEESEKENLEAKKRQQECKQLNKRLASLELRPTANKTDKEGNVSRMTEEERQKDISNTKKQINEKCS